MHTKRIVATVKITIIFLLTGITSVYFEVSAVSTGLVGKPLSQLIS